jgi:hypothetical protein
MAQSCQLPSISRAAELIHVQPEGQNSGKAAYDKLLRDRRLKRKEVSFPPAIEMVAAGLRDQTKTLDQRRHTLPMIVELERLYRLRQGPRTSKLVVWKPALFSLARLRSLFQGKRRGRR